MTDGVHPELQRHPPAEPPAQALDHLAQEGGGLLGIVDLAGPILAPQDVARLRQMGQQGIVAGVLAVVRVEAAKGPGDGSPGAGDRPVDVDGQAGQLQRCNRAMGSVTRSWLS